MVIFIHQSGTTFYVWSYLFTNQVQVSPKYLGISHKWFDLHQILYIHVHVISKALVCDA